MKRKIHALDQSICHSERSEESNGAPECGHSAGFFAALRMTSRVRRTSQLAQMLALLLCGIYCRVALVHAAEPRVIDLWPEGVPDLKPDAGPEKDDNGRFTNIHHPTMVVFAPPAGMANGTA